MPPMFWILIAKKELYKKQKYNSSRNQGPSIAPLLSSWIVATNLFPEIFSFKLVDWGLIFCVERELT